MTGSELKTARGESGWSQARLAKRLRVSQAYVSMLEANRRALPKRLEKRLLAILNFSPLSLSLRGDGFWSRLDDAALAKELASLGYPGFSYMRGVPEWNPAELLVAALSHPSLEARSAEALPWVALHYCEMDWDWILTQARLRNLQNRLGFVVTLARELSEKMNQRSALDRLLSIEDDLKDSLLAAEHTFCRDHITQAEREWLRIHRTPEAQRWNVLSNLAVEHLSHAI